MQVKEAGYYRIRLVQQRTAGGPEMWTAEHPDLLGCHVVDQNPQGALNELSRVRAEWIERARSQGRNVPAPDRTFRYDLILAPDASQEEAQNAKSALARTGAQDIPTIEAGSLTF